MIIVESTIMVNCSRFIVLLPQLFWLLFVPMLTTMLWYLYIHLKHTGIQFHFRKSSVVNEKKYKKKINSVMHMEKTKEIQEIQHNHVQLFIYKITILDTINNCDCDILAIESKIVYEDKLYEWGAGAESSITSGKKMHKRTTKSINKFENEK